jgi:hypothetical protein
MGHTCKWLAAACGGLVISVSAARGLVLSDDFDAYAPGNLDGSQSAGGGWAGGWTPEFNDVGGVANVAGVARITADEPIGAGGAHLQLLGAGPKTGGGGNGAQRHIAGSPTAGAVEFQFDLRIDSLAGLGGEGDAINVYVNGVDSSGLTGVHNVSAWLSYRPDWISGPAAGFDDADWMIRKAHPTSEVIAPGEQDRWIDTGVAVREGAVYAIAVTIDLDADTWRLMIRDTTAADPAERIFDGLEFFEVGNRKTLAARQVVVALWEGSSEASAAAISIDNFGPVTMPEPASVVLLAGGAAAFATWRRVRRRADAGTRGRGDAGRTPALRAGAWAGRRAQRTLRMGRAAISWRACTSVTSSRG